MAFPADFVKRRSPGVWTFLLTAASFGLGGCIVIDNDRHHDDEGWYDDGAYVPPAPAEEPMLVSIKTDATVSADPGEGVGVFVEYAAGGAWRIWTTCDTNYSNVACLFDIYAAVDTASEIIELAGGELEGRDEAVLYPDGVAELSTSTSSDIDELRLKTTPGAILRLEVYLDGVAQPRFVYWQGEEVLHQGAPTSPVDFEPTSP